MQFGKICSAHPKTERGTVVLLGVELRYNSWRWASSRMAGILKKKNLIYIQLEIASGHGLPYHTRGGK